MFKITQEQYQNQQFGYWLLFLSYVMTLRSLDPW